MPSKMEREPALNGVVRFAHLARVFLCTTLWVSACLAVFTAVGYYGNPAKAQEHDFISWGIGMAAVIGIATGLAVALFIAIWAKVSKFTYDGTWKDFRRKTRFLP